MRVSHWLTPGSTTTGSLKFCSTSPDRLAHVAHVPLRDMAGAVEEVRRVKGQGAKGTDGLRSANEWWLVWGRVFRSAVGRVPGTRPAGVAACYGEPAAFRERAVPAVGPHGYVVGVHVGCGGREAGVYVVLPGRRVRAVPGIQAGGYGVGERVAATLAGADGRVLRAFRVSRRV